MITGLSFVKVTVTSPAEARPNTKGVYTKQCVDSVNRMRFSNNKNLSMKREGG